MAEGKNTIIFYRDWKDIFESLEDKDCAELIRHIFRYVNDENPQTDNPIVNAVFIPIRNSLKRDLKKWESIREKRSEAGKASAESRKQNQQMLTNVESVQQTSTNPTVSDSDSDSVNDNVNVNEYKNILLSKIFISDYPDLNNDYLEIAKSFQELFKHNLEEKNIPAAKIEKAKGTWIDDIRLIIETDKFSIDDLRDVWKFLQKDDFWKQNIQSTKKLREQMTKLLAKARSSKLQNNSDPAMDKLRNDIFNTLTNG